MISMKPENWDKLDKGEKYKIAVALLKSKRGEYILSQALCKAIEVMKKEPEGKREVSNIEDMEILLEIFPLFKIFEEGKKVFEKGEENGFYLETQGRG